MLNALQGHGVFIFTWQFFIPLIVFIVSYWKILAMVRRRAKVLTDHARTGSVTPTTNEPTPGTSGAIIELAAEVTIQILITNVNVNGYSIVRYGVLLWRKATYYLSVSSY